MSVPPQHLPVTDQTRLQNLQNFVAGAPSDSQLSGKKNEDGSITLFLRLTTPAKDSDGKPVWNPGVSQGDNERAQQAVTRIVAQTAQRMNLPATLGSASQSAPKTLTPLAASSSPQEPRLQIASARRAVDGVTQAAQSSHSSATPTLRPTNIQTQFVKYITDIENSFLEPDGSALADLFQPKEDSENPTALIEQIVSLASQFQNKTIKASAFNQNITPFVITIGAKISSHLNQKLTQSERQCYIICEGTNLSASILSKLENINSKFKTLEKPIKDNISMRIINFALNFLENKVTPEHFDKKTKDILYLGTEEYRFLKNIGIGGEGAVDLYESPEGHKKIALKSPLPSTENTPESRTRTRNEIFLHRAAEGPTNNNYIIGLKGVIRNLDGTISIALEYANQGDLSRLMKENMERKKSPVAQNGKFDSKLLQSVHGMCKALEYLHDSRKMLHQDLKPHNFLICEDGTVKLADFGTMKDASEWVVSDSAAIRVINSRWQAPEVVKYRSSPHPEPQAASSNAPQNTLTTFTISQKSDVWSFAVSALQLITGHDIFNNTGPLEILPFDLLPFVGEDKVEEIDNIEKRVERWNSDDFEKMKKNFAATFESEDIELKKSIKYLHHDSKDLIMGLISCFHPDPELRPSISQFLATYEAVLVPAENVNITSQIPSMAAQAASSS